MLDLHGASAFFLLILYPWYWLGLTRNEPRFHKGWGQQAAQLDYVSNERHYPNSGALSLALPGKEFRHQPLASACRLQPR
jgi:hypothetical protein